jgi:hypothetical protein
VTEQRWLDAAAAAAYCTLTEAGFRRRVRAGLFPKPNYAAGAASPRWDRQALDAKFAGGSESTDVAAVFKSLADEIAAAGGLRSRRLDRKRGGP